MRVVIVYESMFGNTRKIAEAIGDGLAGQHEVQVINVNHVAPEVLESADLAVVGGPTHVHGMSRPATRAEAQKWTRDPLKKNLHLEPEAPGRGIREWLEDRGTRAPALYASFATRVDMPMLLSGNAAGQIDRMLARRSAHRLMDAESFLVTKDSELAEHEIDRARAWGTALGKALSAARPRTAVGR